MNGELQDDRITRMVWLPVTADVQFSQLAAELNVTKSELISAAIRAKLGEWLSSSNEVVLHELKLRPEARSGPDTNSKFYPRRSIHDIATKHKL